MTGALSTLVVFVGLFATVANAQSDRPLPLDPLTPRELARAGQHCPLRCQSSGIPRRRPKPADWHRIHRREIAARCRHSPTASQPRRTAEALLYRYDTNRGMQALVDIGKGAVIDIAAVPGESVPINKDEVAEAARLALADPRVARLFGDRMPAFRVQMRAPTLEEANQPRIEGYGRLAPRVRIRVITAAASLSFFTSTTSTWQMNRVYVDLISQRVFINGGGR